VQQRRLRLGDVLDDYCPRERRITNHVVVAMIGEDVKQTRCSTCDADHEYKHARVPPPRRRKTGVLTAEGTEGILRRPARHENHDEHEIGQESEGLHEDHETLTMPEEHVEDSLEAHGAEDAIPEPSVEIAASDAANGQPTEPAEDTIAAPSEEEGPVHRRLIRATLPRPEGQTPDRKIPEFTIRQPGGRGGREFDGNKAGGPHRGGRGRRMRTHGGGASSGQSTRFGGGGNAGPRHGTGPRHGSGHGQRHQGNRPGPGGGHRGPGQGRGPGGGGGRKRGR
jgi:hypothetical protein